MTSAEYMQEQSVLDFRDLHIVVSRADATVQVAMHSPRVTPELVRRLRHVLVDLTEGQGNLSISIELPELLALDADLLDVILETAERLVSRHGTVTVRTAVGEWSRPPRTPRDVA